MFCDERYSATQIRSSKGDRLLLYTDGLTEARNRDDVEYGKDRVQLMLNQFHDLPTEALVSRLVKDAQQFADGMPITDDLTLMAIELAGH
jgi:serine phosphatase RsbU (regulator of sigma subunit)